MNYVNARVWKLAMPRIVAVTLGAISKRARLNVVDDRWVPSGASLCAK